MKVFVLCDRGNSIDYITETHFLLIRERFARGEPIISLVYDLPRPMIAKIISASYSELREIGVKK